MIEEQGYEFCKMGDAEEWYDFHVKRWKRVDMAGYFCDNRLFRRKIAQEYNWHHDLDVNDNDVLSLIHI